MPLLRAGSGHFVGLLDMYRNVRLQLYTSAGVRRARGRDTRDVQARCCAQ